MSTVRPPRTTAPAGAPQPTRPVSARRSLLLAVAAAVVAVAALGVLLVRSGSDPALSARLSTLSRLVESGEGTSYSDVGATRVLHERDRVRTGATGRAELVYRDGSLTRLDADTEFQLVRLAEKVGRRAYRLNLKVGRSWHRVTKLTSSQERFEVETSNAVAAVRGTTFMVDCTPSQVCTFTVIDGHVVVTTRSGRTITLGPGDSVVISAAGIVGDQQRISIDRLIGSDPWVAFNIQRDGSGPAPATTTSTATAGGGAAGQTISGPGTTADGTYRLQLDEPSPECGSVINGATLVIQGERATIRTEAGSSFEGTAYTGRTSKTGPQGGYPTQWAIDTALRHQESDTAGWGVRGDATFHLSPYLESSTNTMRAATTLVRSRAISLSQFCGGDVTLVRLAASPSPAQPAAPQATTPVCTKEAVQAGVDASGLGEPIRVNGVQCDGDWALGFAYYVKGDYDHDILMRWNGSGWRAVENATEACNSGAVPASLRAFGCESG